MDYEVTNMLKAWEAGTLDQEGKKILIDELWEEGRLAKAGEVSRSLVAEEEYESGLRDIEQAFNSLRRRVDNLVSEASTGFEVNLFTTGMAKVKENR